MINTFGEEFEEDNFDYEKWKKKVYEEQNKWISESYKDFDY